MSCSNCGLDDVIDSMPYPSAFALQRGLQDVTDSVPYRSGWTGSGLPSGLHDIYPGAALQGADAGVNVTPGGVQVNSGISWGWLALGFVALDALWWKKFLFKR